MVLKVPPIPPVRRGALHKVDNAIVQYMVPLGCAAHGEVSEVVLQPASLGLHCCQENHCSQPWEPRGAKVPENEDGQHLHQDNVHKVS